MVDKILKFNHNGWCEAINKSYQKGYYRPVDSDELNALQGYASEVIDLAGQEIKVIRKPQYPVTVGTEAERFEDLYEGEGYYTADSYRFYLGGGKGKPPFIVKGFPYYLIQRAFWGEDIIRYYVDPVNGDDENDGQTWETAKKGFNNIFDGLPSDLKGFRVILYVQSGTIQENVVCKSSHNGSIIIYKVGTWVNGGTSDLDLWIQNGVTNPVRDDEPLYIEQVDTTRSIWEMHGDNLELRMMSINENYAHHQVGYCQFDRIILKATSESTPNSHNWGFYFESQGGRCELIGVGIIPGGTKSAVCYASASSGGLAGIHIIGVGTGEAFTSTSGWRSLFVLAHNGASGELYLGKVGGGGVCKYDSNFEPTVNTATIVVDNAKTLFSDWYGVCIGTIIDIDGDDFLYLGDESGFEANPVIRVHESFSGVIKYPSADLTLSDNSIKSRTIKDYTTGVEKIFITNSMLQNGSNMVFDLPISDPAVDGALWNDAGVVKVSAGT